MRTILAFFATCLLIPAASTWAQQDPVDVEVESESMQDPIDSEMETDATTDSLPSVPAELVDPGFKGFVDLSLLRKALAERDASLAADVGLQLTEGERVLGRTHKAISAKTVLALAARIAGTQRDTATLDRLGRFAKRHDDKALAARVAVAAKLAGTPRAADPALTVSTKDTTVLQFAIFRNLLQQLKTSELIRNPAQLKELADSVDSTEHLSDQQKDYLHNRIARAQKNMPSKADGFADALKKLMSGSREAEEEGKADIPIIVNGAFLNPGLPSANRQVLRFAVNNEKRRVGDGECAALASAALRYANARRTGPYGPNADYVWGRYVGTYRPSGYSGAQVLAGDILQFRDARLEWRTGNRRFWKTARHHTAIVTKVSGNTLYVAHQNVGGVRRVVGGRYPFNSLTKGWVKVYRPNAGGAPASSTITRQGRLAAGDSRFQQNPRNRIGCYYDVHNFNLRAGRRYVIEVRSSQFDTYLFVASNRKIRASNDDYAGSRQVSRIVYTPTTTGTYQILVSSYRRGETGSYTLTLR